MAYKRIPFPESIIEFADQFSTEEDCWNYLVLSRWPRGFFCPYDGTPAKTYIKTRKLWECQEGHQISATTATVMHSTRQPLRAWFWVAYLMSTKTPGISAKQMARQLDMRYETTYMMMQKLRAGMVDPDRGKLYGNIEMDETFIGGKGKGVKQRGRAYVPGRSIVLGAVEVRGRGFGRIRLRQVGSTSQKNLTQFALDHIKQGSAIITDDYQGYRKLWRHYYIHEIVKGEDAIKMLKHIHIIFSNLKTFIKGTYHGVSKKHLQTYLNEFMFRFNRRKSPMAAFQTLLRISTIVPPPEYKTFYRKKWQPMNGLYGERG